MTKEEGGGGGQKSQKIDDVFYERPLTKKVRLQLDQHRDRSSGFIEHRILAQNFG